jgi:hypothetical protein
VRYFEHWKKIISILGGLYPAMLSFKIEGEIKTFHDKQKLKQYKTTKTALQKILRGILHIEDENKHSHRRMGLLNFK